MFERYTEKARRVIFYARYETTKLGGETIDTEHLLLGLLREDRQLSSRIPDGYTQFLQQVTETSGLRPKHPESMDLPLSSQGKRVLAHAAEEAEILNDKHIGTEHLLLGVLRERDNPACKFLEVHGLNLEQERRKLAAEHPSDAAVAPSVPSYPHRDLGEIVKLHGANWRSSYLKAIIARYVRFVWERQTWKPSDILLEKPTGRVMFHAGQEFDQAKFELQRSGWKQDECVVCCWRLFEGSDPEHGVGYTNGRDWLCTECFDKFFAPPVSPLHDLYT